MKALNRRGQIFTTDLILASVVFLFILTLSIVYSTQAANRVELMEEDKARATAAMSAANSLLLSSGKPANWQNLGDLNNVSSIGIVKSKNEIDSAKLQHLLDLNESNYEGVRDLLGVGKYGLSISVLRLSDQISVGEFGLDPESDDKVTAVNRIALHDGNAVVVRLKVFEE